MPNLIRFLSSLSLTCLVTLAVAQVTISGKVVTSAGNTPVANASVYINNTFTGTTTNDAGEFTLTADYSGGFDNWSFLSFYGFRTPKYLIIFLIRRTVESGKLVFK